MSEPVSEDLQATLADAHDRLASTLQLARSGAALSFSTGPEAELLQTLASRPEPETDAGASEQRGRRLLAGLLELGAVRTETRVDGSVVAATTISLGGDAVTTISPLATTAQLGDHGERVGRTLETRNARMRVASTTIQFALEIAAATGTGNPWWALLAAARFVEGVLAQRNKTT